MREPTQGLALCRSYWEEIGAPALERRFPAQFSRMAAGLVGDGSECYGLDDEVSRDHDWGPGFCLWLGAEDFAEIGAALQAEYERLPQDFGGFRRLPSEWGGGRVGVLETGAFYRKFVGLPRAPRTLDEWFRIPEDFLSACTNGEVFADPLGAFSDVRAQLLRFYPEDVRLAKIAARCMSCAQAGQYNYARCAARGERFAARYAETKFCNDLMSLVFLVNRVYAPYYKWRHRALASLPKSGALVAGRISKLLAAGRPEQRRDLIEELCADAIRLLRDEGLTGLTSASLLDHGPAVHERIRDAGLRAVSVWVG